MRRELTQIGSNYEILDYIEPKMGAIINPKIPLNYNSYTIELEYMKTTSDKNMAFFGASDSGSNFSGIPYWIQGTQVYVALGSSNGVSQRTITLNQKRTYSLTVNKSNHTYSVNDNGTVVSGSYSGTPTTTNEIVLFNHNSAGRGSEPSWGIRYYAVKITVDGTLFRDFVPAKELSTGVVGLYDQQGSICHITGTPLYIAANYFDYGTIS